MTTARRALPYIRANIQGMPRWNPTATPPSQSTGRVHRMDLNECPYPPSPKVVAALQAFADKLNRYPNGVCPVLSERLSERTGVPAQRICWGTGSTELIGSIVRMAVAPGDRLVASSPIWRRFSAVFRVVDAEVAAVSVKPDGALDIDAMLGAIDRRTRIFICLTPNNPTGMMLTADEIRRVVREVPDDVLLYLDEAYHEFAVHAGGADALKIAMAERPGPWIVSRTFSKAYGLAGLRLGYAYCSSDEIADGLRAVTSTFNVSAFGEVAGLAALEDPDYTRMILEKTAIERERVTEGLAALGCAVLPSATNFVSADVGVSGSEMQQALRARGIRVGVIDSPGWESYIRVSMGVPEDTDALFAGCKEVLDDMRRKSA